MNTGYISAYAFIDKFLFLILLLYTAKFYGVEFVGKYVFLISFNAFLFLPFGIRQLIIRTISRNKKSGPSILGNTIVFESIINILRVIILAVYLTFVDFDYNYKLALVITAVGFIFQSYSTLFNSIFISHQRMFFLFFSNSVKSVIVVLFSIVLLFLNFGILSIAIGFFLGFFIAFFINLFFILYYFQPPKFNFNFPFLRWLCKEGWPFILTTLNQNLAFRSDIIIIQVFLGFEFVGIYYAASNIADAIFSFFMAYIYSAYPQLSHLAKKSIAKINKFFKKLLFYSLILGVVTCILILVSSKLLIILIYSKDFLFSVNLLRAFGVLTIFRFVITLYFFYVSALMKQRFNAIISVIFSPLNILFDIFMVSILGLYGLIISHFIFSIIILITYIIYIKYYFYKYNKKIKNSPRPHNKSL